MQGRSDEMIHRSHVGQASCSTGHTQDRSFKEQKGCKTYAVQDGCRTSYVQDRMDAGQEVVRSQDNR